MWNYEYKSTLWFEADKLREYEKNSIVYIIVVGFLVHVL